MQFASFVKLIIISVLFIQALYLKKPAPPCSMIWWPGEVITSYVKVNKLRCTLAADVATAGMLIHFVLSGGQHPFGQQVKEIVDNLIMGKWNLVTSDNNADDLISWMLIFIPENRPSIPAIVRQVLAGLLQYRIHSLEILIFDFVTQAHLFLELGQEVEVPVDLRRNLRQQDNPARRCSAAQFSRHQG